MKEREQSHAVHGQITNQDFGPNPTKDLSVDLQGLEMNAIGQTWVETEGQSLAECDIAGGWNERESAVLATLKDAGNALHTLDQICPLPSTFE